MGSGSRGPRTPSRVNSFQDANNQGRSAALGQVSRGCLVSTSRMRPARSATMASSVGATPATMKMAGIGTVSYTHLTLPTIYSV